MGGFFFFFGENRVVLQIPFLNKIPYNWSTNSLCVRWFGVEKNGFIKCLIEKKKSCLNKKEHIFKGYVKYKVIFLPFFLHGCSLHGTRRQFFFFFLKHDSCLQNSNNYLIIWKFLLFMKIISNNIGGSWQLNFYIFTTLFEYFSILILLDLV